MIWFKVQTYTEDTHGQLKLISDVIKLIAWLCKKMDSYLSIRNYSGYQSDDVICGLLLSRAILWSKFQHHTICGIWDSRGWVFVQPYSTNHVYIKSFLYKGLKIKFYFNLLKKEISNPKPVNAHFLHAHLSGS